MTPREQDATAALQAALEQLGEWRQAEVDAKQVAGHEYGLWPMGATVTMLMRDRRIAELEAKANDFDAEMTMVARTLTAAFEDGRLNANDKRNAQLSDIAESKKWQTEKVDSLKERIAELEAALVSIRRRVDHKTDRSDYEACIDMCPACLCDQPKPALDALLAQAKREAAQECMAIAKEVSESYDKEHGFPSHHAVGAETVAVTIREKFGLGARRMAREVEP